MEPTPEAAAMSKLLRKTAPYAGPRYVVTAKAARELGMVERAEQFERQRLEGDLYRLTTLEAFELEVWLGQALKRIQDKEIDTDVRQNHLFDLRCKLFCLYALRRPGSEGKVRLLTEEEVLDLEPQVAQDVMRAYLEAFVLTEDERPKAEAPRSTSASQG